MERLRHFYANAGFWGALRFVLVGGVFLVVGVAVLLTRGHPGPLICLAVGVTVPVLLRRRVVAAPERSSRIARGIGYGLVAAAFLYGLVRERMAEFPAPGLLLGTLGFVVSLYLGLYAVLYSDPTILITARARR